MHRTIQKICIRSNASAYLLQSIIKRKNGTQGDSWTICESFWWNGGKGKNYANDLKQEHLVKCNKVILRGLCGNKTLKAVMRSTQSAYNVKMITVNFDNQTNIKPESHEHMYGDPGVDISEMVKVLRKLKPFSFNEGRKHSTFSLISKSPLNNIDVASLDAWLTSKKKAIAKNPFLGYEPEGGDENDDSDNDDNIVAENLAEEDDM